MVNIIKYNNIPNQAFQVQSVIEELFEGQVIGIYLYGSAILGGLHINSDIDILVIVNQNLSEETRTALTTRLMLISGQVGCKDKRPLEVSVMNQDDIISGQFPLKCEYMYGEWLREEIEAGEIPQSCYDPDITILLWQTRDHSVPIQGPEAKDIIMPIPMEHIRKAIQESLPGLIASVKGDERNVLLTLARMWYTIATGEICPKDAAAEWAIPRLPKNLTPVLKTARKAYLVECDDCLSYLDVEINLCIEYMSTYIKEYLTNQ